MLGSRTDLHIFDADSVNGARYCNEILLPYVRLFRGAMGLQFLFMDDNAPCHRTVAAEQLLESRRLAARTLPPVTIRELRLALQNEWAAMPQQHIDTLILSIGRRCETCLAILTFRSASSRLVSAALLKQKSIHAIEELLNSAKNQVIANTNVYSDSDLDKGGVGIYFIHPNEELKSFRIPTGKVSSNFTPSILAKLPQHRPKPHGPSAVLFAKGSRHSKGYFGRLRCHLVSLHRLDKTTTSEVPLKTYSEAVIIKVQSQRGAKSQASTT
ncbi:uncharacterized protein TNCV_831451 [Trichonephila clavipes]|nr:uncharacterized protein TNCV_831451 [Trichonephila clavipes]